MPLVFTDVFVVNRFIFGSIAICRCLIPIRMLLTIPIVAFVLITGFGNTKAQELQPNVIIDESIGDTLDSAERNHFELFKTVEEFKWAVFFVDSDSTVYAKICSKENGKPKFATYSYGPIGNLWTQINKAPIYDKRAQIIKAQLYHKMRPWRNTVYLAIGLGNPQSPRYELGYNTKSIFAIALTVGKNNGRFHKEHTVGFFKKLNYQYFNRKLLHISCIIFPRLIPCGILSISTI